MYYVTSVRYNILLKGNEIGKITPSWGLRQGDPLSPFLFLICVQHLNLSLHDIEDSGFIYGCQVACGAPFVSHFLFTDDC